jgi:hypothetical protein
LQKRHRSLSLRALSLTVDYRPFNSSLLNAGCNFSQPSLQKNQHLLLLSPPLVASTVAALALNPKPPIFFQALAGFSEASLSILVLPFSQSEGSAAVTLTASSHFCKPFKGVLDFFSHPCRAASHPLLSVCMRQCHHDNENVRSLISSIRCPLSWCS